MPSYTHTRTWNIHNQTHTSHSCIMHFSSPCLALCSEAGSINLRSTAGFIQWERFQHPPKVTVQTDFRSVQLPFSVLHLCYSICSQSETTTPPGSHKTLKSDCFHQLKGLSGLCGYYFGCILYFITSNLCRKNVVLTLMLQLLQMALPDPGGETTAHDTAPKISKNNLLYVRVIFWEPSIKTPLLETVFLWPFSVALLVEAKLCQSGLNVVLLNSY